MDISVIIPTYNRQASLLRSLQSLQEQSLPEFEILVVDNAASLEIERLVATIKPSVKVSLKYVPEPKLGLHHARHAGAVTASGRILVFSDDDATFDSGWLQAYARAFSEHPEMAAAGGPVRPRWEAPPPEWLLEFMESKKIFPMLSLMEPYKEFRLDPKGFFFGVNMAIRHDILFEVGGFNPESFGDIWLGDGETGLNRKLCRLGMSIGYVPDAIVYHHISPERMTLEYFCRRMANEGASDMYAFLHQGTFHWLPCLLHATSIVVKNAIFWLAARLLNGRTDRISLRIQLHASRTRSRLEYIVRAILDKDLQELVLKDDWLNESCT